MPAASTVEGGRQESNRRSSQLMMPSAVSDPTFGQVSATNFAKGFNLAQTLNAGLVDIVVGRRDLSDYDQLVKDWQTNGGEQVRKEYTDSINGA